MSHTCRYIFNVPSVSILHDKTHPLHSCFQYLPSGRRLKVPLAKKNVYKKSFIPTAVSVISVCVCVCVRERERERERAGEGRGESERERELELENLILKDSNIRSIWT